MESSEPLITVAIDKGLGTGTALLPNGSPKNNSMNSDSFSLFRRPPVLVGNWWRKNCKKCCMTSLQIIIPLVYIVYMICAVYYEPQRSVLLVFDFVLLFIWLYVFTKQPRRILPRAKYLVDNILLHIQKVWKYKFQFRLIITITISLMLLCLLALDWYHDKEKMIPFGGLVVMLLLVYLTSKSPSKVEWTPVIWGVILQVSLGLIILRWPVGYSVCKFIGDQVAAFLAYADSGSRFVFGDQGLIDHPIVFKILPVVVFFSAIINILYYLGAMQVIIKAIAHVLKFAMKTSPMESFATSAHIFVGQVESSIALKPFLKDISRSELNAVMTGGFATVAGTVIGAYIEFGVPANHLIAASFMSAPAALAVAKLGWPEQKELQSINMDNIQLNVGKETNLMEAASAGATSTIKLVAYVVVNLIAFMAILSFVDAIILFYGDRIGYSEVNFEWICSYIFMPLAVIMGIPWKDCRVVATLIGKKIVFTEFLAYIDLGNLINKGRIEGRSGVIATYILCGFGSFVSMGIVLGSLTAAEPSRRKDYAKGVFRAFVYGNVACFMTACIAGMLYIEPIQTFTNSTDLKATFSSPFSETVVFETNSSILDSNTG